MDAGITIGVVVIPQGIAYAMLAELPPVWGLYGALMPLPIYALLGSSKHISIGPFALVSILVAETVSPVVAPEDAFGHHRPAYAAAVCLMSLMVGCMHLLMAALNLDVVVVSFLSEPVLSGFTSASAILIAASQLKHVLGLPIPRTSLPQMIHYAIVNFKDSNGSAIAFGVLGYLALPYIKDINKRLCPRFVLPEQLVLIIVSILLCWYLYDEVASAAPSDEHGWTSHWGLREWGNTDSHFWPPRLVGVVPAGLPSPRLPPIFDFELVSQLFMPSLVVGLFAYILSMSIVRTMAIKYDYSTDSNQELVALGFANMIGSCFSSYPAAGSLSRSALVATTCGAVCTPLHGVWTAAIVLLVLIALTPCFRTLPYAALASIVFASVKSLLDFATPRRLWKLNRIDFVLWIVAFGCTLGLGVKLGITLSVACSLVALIMQGMRPPHGLLGRLPGTSNFVDVRSNPHASQMEGVAIFYFSSTLHFANKDFFRDELFAAIRRAHDTHEKSGRSTHLRRQTSRDKQRSAGRLSGKEASGTSSGGGSTGSILELAGRGAAADVDPLSAAEAAWKRRVDEQKERVGTGTHVVAPPTPPPASAEEAAAAKKVLKGGVLLSRPAGNSATDLSDFIADDDAALSDSALAPSMAEEAVCPAPGLAPEAAPGTAPEAAPEATPAAEGEGGEQTSSNGASAVRRSLADSEGWDSASLLSPVGPPASNLPFPSSRSDLGFSPGFSPAASASPDVAPTPGFSPPASPVFGSIQSAAAARKGGKEPRGGGSLAASGSGGGGGAGAGSSSSGGAGGSDAAATPSPASAEGFRSPPVTVPDEESPEDDQSDGSDDEGECRMVSVVVIDFSGIPSLDTTALRMLEDVRRELAARGLKLLTAGTHGQARDVLMKAGFFEALGMENVFMRVDGAASRACMLAGSSSQEPGSFTTSTSPDSPLASAGRDFARQPPRILQRSLTPQAKWTHSMVSNHWARQGLLDRQASEGKTSLL